MRPLPLSPHRLRCETRPLRNMIVTLICTGCRVSHIVSSGNCCRRRLTPRGVQGMTPDIHEGLLGASMLRVDFQLVKKTKDDATRGPQSTPRHIHLYWIDHCCFHLESVPYAFRDVERAATNVFAGVFARCKMILKMSLMALQPSPSWDVCILTHFQQAEPPGLAASKKQRSSYPGRNTRSLSHLQLATLLSRRLHQLSPTDNSGGHQQLCALLCAAAGATSTQATTLLGCTLLTRTGCTTINQNTTK